MVVMVVKSCNGIEITYQWNKNISQPRSVVGGCCRWWGHTAECTMCQSKSKGKWPYLFRCWTQQWDARLWQQKDAAGESCWRGRDPRRTRPTVHVISASKFLVLFFFFWWFLSIFCSGNLATGRGMCYVPSPVEFLLLPRMVKRLSLLLPPLLLLQAPVNLMGDKWRLHFFSLWFFPMDCIHVSSLANEFLLFFRMSLNVEVGKFSIHSPESIEFMKKLDPDEYVLQVMEEGLKFDLISGWNKGLCTK